MIARLLPTLAAKIAGGIAVALLLAVLVSRIQVGSLERQAERLQDRIGALTRDLAQCRTNVATLDAAVSRQNEALASVRAASAAREAQLERATAQARQQSATARSQAAAILARRPGADQCADALSLIRGN